MAVTGGLLSIPLCFHLDTVMWFNDNFVRAEPSLFQSFLHAVFSLWSEGAEGMWGKAGWGVKREFEEKREREWPRSQLSWCDLLPPSPTSY